MAQPSKTAENRNADLAKKVKQFIGRHRMAKTDFGLRSANDPNLYDDLVGGTRRIRASTVRRIETFMEGYDAMSSLPSGDRHEPALSKGR